MLVVVERRKADQGFPMGHQNGRRHEQQPWQRIDREQNENTGSQGSKKKASRNLPKTGGGPKTQDDRRGKDRERKKEERRRKDKKRGTQGTKAWESAALF